MRKSVRPLRRVGTAQRCVLGPVVLDRRNQVPDAVANPLLLFTDARPAAGNAFEFAMPLREFVGDTQGEIFPIACDRIAAIRVALGDDTGQALLFGVEMAPLHDDTGEFVLGLDQHALGFAQCLLGNVEAVAIYYLLQGARSASAHQQRQLFEHTHAGGPPQLNSLII